MRENGLNNNNGLLRNMINNKKMFSNLLLIILLFSPNYYVFDMAINSEDISVSFSDSNSKFSPIEYKYNQQDDELIDINLDQRQTQDNRLVSINDIPGSSTAFIGIENETSSSKFSFIYEESVTDDGSITSKANDHIFTVTTINSTGYDNLDIDVDTYTQDIVFSLEKAIDSSANLLDANTFAQSAFLESLKYGGSNIRVSGFNITNAFTPSGVNLTGSVWSATLNGSNLVPNVPLQNTSMLTAGGAVENFIFSSPININSSNTYTNGTGGYIFFILYHGITGQSAPFFRTSLDSVTGNDGLAYLSTIGPPPTHPDNWTTAENFDYTIEYNASIEFDPFDIDTTINASAVSSNGLFTDAVFRSESTDYLVNFNVGKVLGYTTLINVSYVKFLTTSKLANVDYSISARQTELNWSITFTTTYTPTGTLNNYLLVPNNFTDILVYKGASLQTSPTNYEIFPGSINQSISIYSGIGSYKITANSTNLLQYSNPQNYVYDTAWTPQNFAYMGVLYPPEAGGDLINNTLLNPSTLNLMGGLVNSSLRSESGLIFGNASIGGYKDISLSSEVYDFSNNITFSTRLDPNLPLGVYSFQHYWFNGTAGGAIFWEIEIYPVIDLTLITLPEIDILESEVVNFEYEVHDRSHDSDWINAVKTISWELEANVTNLNFDGYINPTYGYSASIDTLKAVNAVQPKSYAVNITLSETVYSQSIFFTFNVYYQGSSNLSGPASVEAEKDFSIYFELVNDTDGGGVFNTSDVLISVNSSYHVAYSPLNENYNITIDWNPAFKFNENNRLVFNWTHPDFRSQADQNYTLKSFDFIVTDGVTPILAESPVANIDFDEDTSGNIIVWNATDPYANQYHLIINDVNQSLATWTNSGEESINLDTLERGIYNYTIIYYDLGNNYVIDTRIFTVSDVTIPEVSSLGVNAFAEGGTGQVISWTVGDKHPDTYTISRNITDIPTEIDKPWTNGSIDLNIDGLSFGLYIFELTIFDDTGNFETNQITVTIFDSNDPSIETSPVDLDYEENSVGNSVTWNVTDLNPNYYDLFRNGSLISPNIPWISSELIVIGVDGLDVGVYVFRIVFYDETGNSFEDTVFVEVFDSVSPVIDEAPTTDIRIFVGGGDYNITWAVTDNNPGTYQILLDSVEIDNGNWINSVNISYNIGQLSIGVYNLTLIVYDSSLNSVLASYTITVKDPSLIETKIPDFVTNSQYYEGTLENTSSVWYSLANELILDASVNITLVKITDQGDETLTSWFIDNNADGQFFLLFNYTGLVPSDYKWILTFEKVGYEDSTITKLFEITPHSLSIEITFDEELIQGEEFRISIKVTYDNPASYLSLNSITSTRSGGVVGAELFILIGITIGEELLTLNLNGTTNENGLALIVLDKDTTITISQINSIGVNFYDTLLFVSQEITLVPTDNLPPIIEADVNISGIFDDINEYISENLPLVLALLLIILITATVFFVQVRKKRERKKLYTRLKIRTTEEIKGLLNINAIIMKSTFTGLQFYERVFEDAMNLDLALLAGITTAITNVLSEIKEDEMGFETMQRSGLSITMYKGEMITMIFVSNEELPDLLKLQVEEAHKAFEDEFHKMKDETQNLNLIPMDVINDLLYRFIKISLKENLIINAKTIKKISSKKSINRRLRSNIKHLTELYESVTTAGVPLTLYTIYEFLSSKKIDEDQIYQIISTAYAYGVIDTQDWPISS